MLFGWGCCVSFVMMMILVGLLDLCVCLGCVVSSRRQNVWKIQQTKKLLGYEGAWPDKFDENTFCLCSVCNLISISILSLRIRVYSKVYARVREFSVLFVFKTCAIFVWIEYSRHKVSFRCCVKIKFTRYR